jgi:nucleoside-diphosphate-sugar epimerase
LEELLSRPSDLAVRTLGELEGDVLVLGVGGKMGPTLARMAKRALDQAGVQRRVIGVSRFSDEDVRRRLEDWGVETIACDLLNEDQIQSLPAAPNLIFMAGMKFGATGNPSLTWAMNCYVPALVCRRFCDSRIVAFSSGNVYPMVPVDSSGSTEDDLAQPVGEYAMSVLGRERICEHFSLTLGTPAAILRLNYATELRYGVLYDIAQDVFAGRPIDLTMSKVNVIWQADANAMALVALAHTSTPAKTVNVAGPEMLRVRDVAEQFGRVMNKPVQFVGEEGSTAFLNDGRSGRALLGSATVDADQMIPWIADWVVHGGQSLGKPTHFQTRDGKY